MTCSILPLGNSGTETEDSENFLVLFRNNPIPKTEVPAGSSLLVNRQAVSRVINHYLGPGETGWGVNNLKIYKTRFSPNFKYE